VAKPHQLCYFPTFLALARATAPSLHGVGRILAKGQPCRTIPDPPNSNTSLFAAWFGPCPFGKPVLLLFSKPRRGKKTLGWPDWGPRGRLARIRERGVGRGGVAPAFLWRGRKEPLNEIRPVARAWSRIARGPPLKVVAFFRGSLERGPKGPRGFFNIGATGGGPPPPYQLLPHNALVPFRKPDTRASPVKPRPPMTWATKIGGSVNKKRKREIRKGKYNNVGEK